MLMVAEQLTAPEKLQDPLRHMALQLEAAHSALATARRTQSEFLCALGHELRSPMTSILGFAQLMDAGVPTPTSSQKHSLGQILEAGWDLMGLIDELLDASLIESGKLPLQMETVSLEDVMRDCEKRVEPLAGPNNATLVFAWPAQPLLVTADRNRLRQILMTLIEHSLLHSGATGTVQVSGQRCENGHLRVHFQDSSAGQSAAWLANSQPIKNIKLTVSQQLAGYMGGLIATERIASTGGNASGYWLELIEADSTL